jgi:FkbM family methyltransferase
MRGSRRGYATNAGFSKHISKTRFLQYALPIDFTPLTMGCAMHLAERLDLIARLDALVQPHRRPLAEQLRRTPLAAVRRILLARAALAALWLGWNVTLSRRLFTSDETEFPFPACWDLLVYRTYVDEAELRLLKFLIRSLPGSAVVLDVGANIGVVCQLTSRLVGDQGRVYGFEPGQQALRYLHRNLAGRANCQIVEQAAMDREGDITFHEGTGAAMVSSSAVGSHAQDRNTGSVRSVTVSATTLDAFCAGTGAVPTLIKIDVEGAELMVLRGAAGLLATVYPAIILEVSFRPDEHTAQYAPCIDLLVAAGYVPHVFAADGTARPIARDAIPSHGAACTKGWGYLHMLDNLLFLHPGGVMHPV